MPITITFHESQYPSRIAEQLRHGLRAHRLPMKFLYDSPAQAQRWLAYHHAYAPASTMPEVSASYQRAMQHALQVLGPCALHYISLGCGSGSKDAWCLRQAVAQGTALSFTPMDTSAALVIETLLRIRRDFPDLPSLPLVVDLETAPDLEAWLCQQETVTSRRLLACFGMIPNFEHAPFLQYIRSLMRPGDLLLLSANLSPGPYAATSAHILPQYDNSLARAWFAGALESLGIPLAHSHLIVQSQPLRPDGHIWQIQAQATFRRPVTITLYGESFAFMPGETLLLFFSTRFTPQIFPDVLAAAGLTVLQKWLFASQEEGIYLCAHA